MTAGEVSTLMSSQLSWEGQIKTSQLGMDSSRNRGASAMATSALVINLHLW